MIKLYPTTQFTQSRSKINDFPRNLLTRKDLTFTYICTQKPLNLMHYINTNNWCILTNNRSVKLMYQYQRLLAKKPHWTLICKVAAKSHHATRRLIYLVQPPWIYCHTLPPLSASPPCCNINITRNKEKKNGIMEMRSV